MNENTPDIATLLREIQELRASLEAERQRSDRLLEAFLHVPVVIFAADDDGGIVFCNDEFRRVTGYDPTDVLDHQHLVDMLLPDPAQDNACPPGFERREWIVRSKDGAERVVAWSEMKDCCPLPDWRRWGVGVDVTAHRRLERLRRDLERLTRHDLRSPLGAVVGYCDLLLDDQTLSAENKEMVRRIQRSGERMAGMIENSLDLYRMEEGRFVMRPEPVDLCALLRAIAEETDPLCAATGLSLAVEGCASGPFFVSGSGQLLESMIGNLVRNALEASPRNAVVRVDFSRSEGSAHISVHNDGVIPDGVRQRFFEPYVTAGKTKGIGLGAYGARLIARAHGGDIAVRSTPEEGTILTVTLPD